ncbi:MAG TPA: heme-binding protein [Stellaceae bacterium]|nr:heme-binding protein [Stellaceae bacterium]
MSNAAVKKHLRLTHAGALAILGAAIAKADAMGVPQCIAIVDDGGNLLAFIRMDGAKFLSVESAMRKAITAVSSRVPTGGVAEGLDMKLAAATSGRLTNLKGGAPITVDGLVIGGIGVGSGTGDQDLEVAKAGLAAIEGASA